MRPYKDELPTNTLRHIYDILENLGVLFSVQHFSREGLYYSCRLTLNDLQPLSIGTNGKGLTPEYSLASAAGEFMERFANRFMFMATKYNTKLFRSNNIKLNSIPAKELSYRYFQDEIFEWISSEKMKVELEHFAPRNLHPNLQLPKEQYPMYYVPFENVSSGNNENLPYQLIRYAASSTGLCAGNTKEEAIMQGIGEIIERYVLQEIYIQRFTPPNIPLSYFDGTEILNRIETLCKEQNFTFHIKDCSLGQGFPVIGLLVYNTAKHQYAFRLGADVNIVTALQRCFTEMFQGADTPTQPFCPITLSDKWDMSIEHDKSVKNWTGILPQELFMSTPSWDFTPNKYPKQKDTFQEEYNMMCEWLQNKGYTLYVRNNSILGFHVYHLYIPNMSDLDYRLCDIIPFFDKESDNFFQIPKNYRINLLDKNEAHSFIQSHFGNTEEMISLFPYTKEFNEINKYLLLALLAYKIGDDNIASESMNNFLQQQVFNEVELDVYYYVVTDYLALIAKGVSLIEIQNTLLQWYPAMLVNEVINDMQDREHVLDGLPLPTCFNCEQCPLQKSCLYSKIMEYEHRIQDIQY